MNAEKGLEVRVKIERYYVQNCLAVYWEFRLVDVVLQTRRRIRRYCVKTWWLMVVVVENLVEVRGRK